MTGNPSTVPLRELYAHELARRGHIPDDAQLAAIAQLERLRLELIAREAYAGSLRGKLARTFKRRAPEPPRGVYLWGGVGRGKTFVMDVFDASLPFGQHRRTHFHRFMHDVHAQLRTLSMCEDPLASIAGRMAEDVRVLCFDELFVSDIGDAMILGGLFDALVARGVTLVFTSNVPPRDLYRGGLQRQRFLPAIALLERHAVIVHLDAGVDYRLRQLTQASLYLDSAAAETPARLESLFATLADGAGSGPGQIDVAGRPIDYLRESTQAIWFTFGALCEGPRSQDDYIEIARDYHSVLLSDVPVLDETCDNPARRFIALVDELYDHGVSLVLAAAAPIHSLYRGTRLRFEFERTISRVTEMQSAEYLAREHRA